jgi:hypothetical protein
MIKTVEYWSDGSTLKSVLEDNGDGTGTFVVYNEQGEQIGSQNMVNLPPVVYAPLDAAGALATLLVVEGLVSITDAANAIRTEEVHLEHEALAWGLWS